MGQLDRFVARENIRIFKEQLVICSSEAQKVTLEQLLAAEKAKLQEIESRLAAHDKQQAVQIEESQSAN